MRFNNFSSGIQSEIDVNKVDHPTVEYIQLMLISLVYYPFDLNHKNVLIIGLGGGVLPRSLRNLYPNCSITIIEIDEIVFELAKKYFYFKEDNRMEVKICDGRNYLNKLNKDIQYDIIYIDAYDSNNSQPFHMKTEEFFLLLKSHLNVQGAFIIFNLISIYQSFFNLCQTIHSVFNSNDFIQFRTKNCLNTIIGISTFSNGFKKRNQDFIKIFQEKFSINPFDLLKNEEKQLKCMDSTIEIYRDQSKQNLYEENLSLKQFYNLN